MGAAFIEQTNQEYNAVGPNGKHGYSKHASELARATFGNDKHTFWNEVDQNWDADTPPT